MSDCARICEILISHLIIRSLEIKNGGLGQRRKNAIFIRLYPQGDYAMLITQKHHRENTSPEYDQSTVLLRTCRRYRMASY